MKRADEKRAVDNTAVPHARLPFCGRDDELRGLRATIAAGGQLKLIVGSAGVGKSRLIDETLEQLDDARVLTGRCWEGGPTHPLLPWLQIAAQAAELLDPESAEPPLRGVANLGALYPHINGEQQFTDHETHLHVLILALAEYLERVAMADANPVIVVIEDLHCADPESISILRWLASQESSLSYVATCRPMDEAGNPTAQAIRALLGEANTLHLSPLGRPAIAELLKTFQMLDHIDEAVTATEGLPLLLNDWVKSIESGDEAAEAGVGRRLERLSSESLDVLSVAAAVGDEFDLGILAEVMDSDLLSVSSLILPACESGLVDSVGDSIVYYRFHHTTYRQACEQRMDIATRAHTHASICAALGVRSGDDPAMLTRLAHHASIGGLAGEFRPAIDLNVRAGEHAMEQAAPAIAEFHFSRALEFATMAGAKPPERAKITVGLARAQQALGSPELRHTVQQATELADAVGDAELRGRAALTLPPTLGSLGLEPEPNPETAAVLANALARLPQAPTWTRGRLLIETANQQFAVLSAVELDVLLDEAHSIARAISSPELAAWVTVARDSAYRPPSQLEHKVRELERTETELGSTSPESRLALAALKVTALMRMGKLTEADQAVGHVESMFAHAPPVVQWAVLRWRAALAHARAELGLAEQLSQESVSVAAGTRNEATVGEYSAMLLGYVLRDRGAQAVALPFVRQWVEDRPTYLPYRAALAWILADMGEADEAEVHLTRVFQSDLTSRRDATDWLPFVTMAGTAAAGIGRAEWASRIVDLIEPQREEWLVLGTGVAIDGPVALRRANMAAAAGRLSEARIDLERGEAAARSAGANTYVVLALSYRARLCELESKPALAVDAYEEAAELAAAHGLDVWAAQLRARKADLSSASAVEVRETLQPAQGSFGRFVMRGKIWHVDLDDSSASVPDAKGMRMLVELLRRPDVDIHAGELSAVADGQSRGRGDREELVGRRTWSADPVLDDEAISSYKARVAVLQESIDEARQANDLARAEEAEHELDLLLAELVRATGLGGRARSLDKSAERARVRVTKALRSAVARIGAVSPLIGGHLESSLQTGTYCAYRPDPGRRITWEL